MNRPKTRDERKAASASVHTENATDLADRRERLWMLVALAWLFGFLLSFYSFDLPNDPNGISRFDIWMLLPTLLPPQAPTDPGASYGWQNIPQRFDLMLVAGVILAGAWGTGHLLLRALQAPLEQRCTERMAFAFGLGLSALSLVTLGCGLAGLLSRGLLGGFIAVAVIGEGLLHWRDLRQSERTAVQFAKPASGKIETVERSSLRWICLAAVCPFVLVMFLGAMLPPTDFDARAYHLEGPKEFFQAGRISFLPHNVYTSFPFLTEMLSLLAMVLHGDWYRGALAGQLLLACFAPLTAVALYAAGRRCCSPIVGWLAATVFLTTPWIYRISIIAYAEGGLAFYLFASVLAVMAGFDVLRQQPNNSARGSGSSWTPVTGAFLLVGLLAGSGMACKYTGLVQVVVPIGIAVLAGPFLIRPKLANRNRALLSTALFFAIGVALAIGPWLLKNVIETGNPVYPLGYSIFDGRDLDEALSAKWNRVHGPRDNRVAMLGFWLVDVMARNDWLSPLLYGLAALSWLVATRRRLIGALWLYAAYLFVAWWLLTHWVDRFWVPMIPVVSLLAGIGAGWSRAPVWRWGAGILVTLAIWFNLGYVTTSLCGYNAYLCDLDAAQRSVENPGFAYLNRALPEEAKVLVVGDGDVFDARVSIVYNTVFDRSIFEEWCAANVPDVPEGELPLRDATEIRARLAKEGITHVYVNWQWILRYRQPDNYGYTDFVSPRRFVELQKLGILGPPQQPANANPRDWGIFFAEYDKVSPQDRAMVEKWGPELRTTIAGTKALIVRQVFPVLK